MPSTVNYACVVFPVSAFISSGVSNKNKIFSLKFLGADAERRCLIISRIVVFELLTLTRWLFCSCVRGYSENDKDCPVCHTKNVQLVDALHAQSQSRGQHELFHNLLDRSTEPFSVVAEYFGRGLFNKIVLVEEDNDEVDLKWLAPKLNLKFFHFLFSDQPKRRGE